jgi:cell division protein ZapA (FtsZ GTPase activity inhibitor)
VERAPLALHIGGTTYKVHSSASAEEMTELARLVDQKLRELNPKNRPMTPQMLLLVALAFAHDAGEERKKREGVQAEARDMLRRMNSRIDAALDDGSHEGESGEGDEANDGADLLFGAVGADNELDAP